MKNIETNDYIVNKFLASFLLIALTFFMPPSSANAEVVYYSGSYPMCSDSGEYYNHNYWNDVANSSFSYCIYQPSEGYFSASKTFIKSGDSFTLTWHPGTSSDGKTGYPGWHRAIDFNNGNQELSKVFVKRVNSYDSVNMTNEEESFNLYPKYGETSCANQFSCEYELDREARFEGYYKLQTRIFLSNDNTFFSTGGYTQAQIEIVKNIPPTASFSVNSIGGGSYDLDASTTSDDGEITDYLWTVYRIDGTGGDINGIPNAVKPRVQLADNAQYNITLEVYDDQGGYGTKSIDFTTPDVGITKTPNEVVKESITDLSALMKGIKIGKNGKLTKNAKEVKIQLSALLKEATTLVNSSASSLDMKKANQKPKKLFKAFKSKIALALKAKSTFKDDIKAAKQALNIFKKALK